MTELARVDLHHDGAELTGRIALPGGPGPHPGVLIVHNGLGLGERMADHARALAAEGYVALAADMYGGGIVYPHGGEAYGEFMDGAPPEAQARLRGRVAAWHDLLRARADVDAARTAAIGYCFGGKCVLELARGGVDARAFVSFHGTLRTESAAAPGAIRGRVAIYTGAKDPYAPREDVAALEAELVAAGAAYDITLFGTAAHGFTDPDSDALGQEGIAHDAMAARLSWAGMLALLKGVFA